MTTTFSYVEYKTRVSIAKTLISFVFTLLAFTGAGFIATAEEQIKTSGELMSLRVAPGELLPVTVKLLNFGTNERVDVTITYKIYDLGKKLIVDETETVAVQTTANFVKNIQIPYEINPGRYSAESTITYTDQEFPATSKFDFTVEKKILGIFAKQFYLYLGISIAFGAALAVLSRLFIKQRRTRQQLHDYSKIPKAKRFYYELINDIVVQMHNSVGDAAYKIANAVKGLKVNEDNGRIELISGDPVELITLLTINYQTSFGKSDNLLSALNKHNINTDFKPVENNLNMISKYFNSKETN